MAETDPQETRQTENEQRHHDARFRLLVETMTDYAIFIINPQGTIIEWNSGATHVFGYTEAEALGQPFSLIFTPEDRQQGEPERELKEALAEGRTPDLRWHKHKDGSLIWIDGVIMPVYDEQRKLTGYGKVARDFTERKWEQEALQAAFAKERHIAEALQRAMLVPLVEDDYPGFAVASFHQAAWAEAEVSGDLYDAFLFGEGMAAFIVGDASGKGLEAASRTAQIKDVCRAFLRSPENAEAGETMTRLNSFLCESKRLEAGDDNGFVCLALVLVDTATGEATFVTAGAEPPLLLRAGGEAEAITLGGLPLGVMPGFSYATTMRV
jgi:PAS domain S-box-containing protein